ncbi:MAG: UDP-N-acetylmuramoyl-L-alanine--D-glutamate ligase [Spirochaetae bacterium HGW-Spirochaetae-1]|jgi:UDP-N-acetylmuramoylalanine--D-glutamate ligase|nr:MAG: UDP-N-acetylmuramoyl-L-alanine--D-glutamate ligase [Spirochaetae bacterium HGW-Spirochaetae-1]
MNIKGKEIRKALVVGLGYRTGLAASNFLSARGVDVSVSDKKSAEDLKDVISRLSPGVQVRAGGQDPSLLDEGFDLVVLSPGVPRSIPLIAAAYERNIPVIAEIELAYTFLRGSIIAITGTDGKSTTTTLTGHILRELGFQSLVGGNIGIPLVSLVDESGDESISVIELSSFQLETIDSFRPDAAAILNVTPDHLDRYDGMDDYFGAKKRVTLNQTADDFYIYNLDDEILRARLDGVKAHILTFSLNDTSADAFYLDGSVYIRNGSKPVKVIDADRLFIMGFHNVQNVMAALLLVISVFEKRGIIPDFTALAGACYSFQGLEHRMERLGTFQGREFINDSKATTVGAVTMALRSITRPGVLILGGRTKGDDYSRLRDEIAGRVKSLVLIGESTNDFSVVFRDFPFVEAGSMDDAVVKAMKESSEGDIILLSPACASFDMFMSFEDRGRVFKNSYNKLVTGELPWT